jgi:hypothetical protein
VNQHGSEGLLEKAFAREAQRYSSSKSAALTYTAFDFHKECGATNYGRWVLACGFWVCGLGVLWGQSGFSCCCATDLYSL